MTQLSASGVVGVTALSWRWMIKDSHCGGPCRPADHGRGWEKHSDFDKGVVINTVLEDGTLQDSLLKQNYSKLFAKLIVCCRRWLSIHNLPCKGLWGTKKDIDPHNTPIWDTMSDFGFWIYYNCEASNPHAGHQSHSAPASCKATGHICWHCWRAGSARIHDPAQVKRAVIQGIKAAPC